MTTADLESKHLAELHELAAREGVSGYRMLPRAELIEALAGGAPPEQAPAAQKAPEESPAPALRARAETAPARPRRRRRRFGRRRSRGGGPREHADRWLEAWNGRDIDAIVACYAEDVEFVIAPVVGDADPAGERLNGRQALREHFRHGLELAPNMKVTEESLLEGPGGFAVLYRREDGHRAIEAVELDEAGLVARARVYYERERP
ncbi:MAG TPA: nuclear transport factor 2 family protein [Solirubrobacterales bacterium]|nr:nuclear transport factor 2 family protein [Solirubrobacterales bacterium]